MHSASLKERFSREFRLDAIILLGRILPKDAKCTFGWRASGSKRLCSSTLLKCWSLFTWLSQLCWIISCRTLYLPFCFSLDLLNLREGAWISDNPVHARRLYIPWFIKFSSLSNTCNAVYSVISIIHLHLISTDFTRKMRREYSAMHFLHVKGGGGALVDNTVKPM